VKRFDALDLAAEAADLFIRSRVRDNQYEIHVRDSFDPVADGGTAEQNHTDQRSSTIGTCVDDRLDIRLNARRNW
jgi:hypothetical protein